MSSRACYLAYGILLMSLAFGCKKADVSTGKDMPPVGSASPTLDVVIKSIRSGPSAVLCELVLTNKTDAPIRVSGFSLNCALGRLKLRDASGQGWHVTPQDARHDPAPVVVDYKLVLPPHVPQTAMVGTFPGAVLVLDQDPKARGAMPAPNAVCRYSLDFPGVQLLDAGMEHSSEVALKIEGDTDVAPR